MSPFGERPTLRGSRGVVACGHPLGAGAALDVLAAGGGAADAAVAAAAALSVVLPDACGLGGDVMALVRRPDGGMRAYNGSGAAPAAVRVPIPSDGGGTVAVPGAVAGWCDLHREHGRLEPVRVLAPAIALAEHGFPVGERLAALLAAHADRLAGRADGWPVAAARAPGSPVRQPALAATLRAIARDGARAFYDGPMAEAVAAAVRRAAGSMTAEDVRAHATAVGDPVVARFAGARLAVQPPVSQALLAPLVLRHLEAMPADPLERTHAAVELVEAAFAYRDAIAEPGAAARLLGVELQHDPVRAARRGGPRGYSHTSAVTAADAEGYVVSMLVSVFDDFGAAVLVPEGGFLLNNRLDGFLGNRDGPNAPRGGAHPVHTLSPVLVDADDCVFALATPGSDGQVQTLVQLLDAIVASSVPPVPALARPRWVSIDRRLLVEETFPAELAAALAARGHDVIHEPAGSPAFGAACLAGVERASGTLYAVTDPRREVWGAAL